MKKNTMALTALGLGAAFLMRNKDSREKLTKQFEKFTNKSSEGNLKKGF